MGADLRRILVVDVECTCWETREEQGIRPNEIIEIGICSLNVIDGTISRPDSYLVRPRFTEVSPFCTRLTGLTAEQIAEGGNITDTLKAIRADYGIGRDTLWCSYGEFDRIKLASDGRASVHGLYGVHRNDNPFMQMRSHINLKTIFALRFGLAKEVGMDAALRRAHLTLEGRHHSGADDAYNIAKIARVTLLTG